MVVMVVVVGFAVEVGDSAQAKENEPADIQRIKIVHGFTQEQHYNVRHHRHHKACGRHKLVRVHFPWVVYLC
jgi:hypothetical protein